jgi:hypothetical protein
MTQKNYQIFEGMSQEIEGYSRDQRLDQGQHKHR